MSTIYNGIQSAAGLVGAGFVLYHGWNFINLPKKDVFAVASPATPNPIASPPPSNLTQPETSIDF